MVINRQHRSRHAQQRTHRALIRSTCPLLLDNDLQAQEKVSGEHLCTIHARNRSTGGVEGVRYRGRVTSRVCVCVRVCCFVLLIRRWGIAGPGLKPGVSGSTPTTLAMRLGR